MYQVTNPHGVSFNVVYEDERVHFFDARQTEDDERGFFIGTLSTLQLKVKVEDDIVFARWIPRANPEWWISKENASELFDWCLSQRDPNYIQPGMYMSDGTIAAVDQRVEFKWFKKQKQGTIVGILEPCDTGSQPPSITKNRWKVSAENYLLWHRALVMVLEGKNGLPTYYGVAIHPASRSCLRLAVI